MCVQSRQSKASFPHVPMAILRPTRQLDQQGVQPISWQKHKLNLHASHQEFSGKGKITGDALNWKLHAKAIRQLIDGLMCKLGDMCVRVLQSYQVQEACQTWTEGNVPGIPVAIGCARHAKQGQAHGWQLICHRLHAGHRSLSITCKDHTLSKPWQLLRVLHKVMPLVAKPKGLYRRIEKGTGSTKLGLRCPSSYCLGPVRFVYGN